jgi:hypothetical protein
LPTITLIKPKPLLIYSDSKKLIYISIVYFSETIQFLFEEVDKWFFFLKKKIKPVKKGLSSIWVVSRGEGSNEGGFFAL